MIKKILFVFFVLFLFGLNSSFFTLNAESSGDKVDRITAENSHSKKKTLKAPEKKVSFKWHQRNLERHFYKHRAEFPEYKTVQEYGNGAIKFFSDPPKGTEYKRRSNGDRLFYYEKNNFFGVTTKDGFIKTFFRPNRGRRYWNRQ